MSLFKCIGYGFTVGSLQGSSQTGYTIGYQYSCLDGVGGGEGFGDQITINFNFADSASQLKTNIVNAIITAMLDLHERTVTSDDIIIQELAVIETKTRSDTYTATGNGEVLDLTRAPLKSFSIQVTGTGAAATTWDVRLEGSLDNARFSQILQHTNVTGNGEVLWATAATPCLYVRSRCSGLVLGAATDIVVTIVGTQ